MNNQPNPKMYLFYCNRCVHSKKLIAKMNSLNILSNFQKCDIDNKALQIPPAITVVPTIFIPIPAKPKIIVSPEIDSWVEEYAIFQQNMNLASSNIGSSSNNIGSSSKNMGPSSNNNMGPSSSNGMIQDFDVVEMGSSYSSINNENYTVTGGLQYITDNREVSNPKERHLNQNNQQNSMVEMGESSDGKDRKKTEMEKRYDDLVAIRDMDIVMSGPQRI